LRVAKKRGLNATDTPAIEVLAVHQCIRELVRYVEGPGRSVLSARWAKNLESKQEVTQLLDSNGGIGYMPYRQPCAGTTQSTRKTAGEQSQSWAGGLPRLLLCKEPYEARLIARELKFCVARDNFYAVAQVVSLSLVGDRLQKLRVSTFTIPVSVRFHTAGKREGDTIGQLETRMG
jgi:hypothetical protein